MAAINSLLLFLTTLAPYSEPPDDYDFDTYSPPTIWPDYTISQENNGDDGLERCFKDAKIIGNIDCPPNQHYQRCGGICEEYCIKYRCPVNCCIEGCFCDEGYAKTMDNSCVKREDCNDTLPSRKPKKNKGKNYKPCVPDMPSVGEMHCPPNEHYKRCGSVCPEACIEYNCPLDCCVEGCFCDKGFVRGFNETCIKKEECFTFIGHFETNDVVGSNFPKIRKCEPDEYIGCDSHCQRNCSNYHDVIPCPAKCVLDCVCMLPMIRGPDGKCILPQQCPSLVSRNLDEDMKAAVMICYLVHVLNPSGPRCFNTVKQCNNPHGCFDDDLRNNGLIASRIEWHNDGKPCFPELEIEGYMDCPPGEHYDRCGPVCFESCIEYDCPLTCCVESCFCDEGYVRGQDANCIPKEQCSNNSSLSVLSRRDPSAWTAGSCGPFESIGCDSHSQRNCSNYLESIPYSHVCALGCVCIPPRIRGPDDNCILPEQCPPAPLTALEESMTREAMICNFLRIMKNPPAWSRSCPMIVEYCSDPDGCAEKYNENPLSSLQEQFFRCSKKNEFLNMCAPTCPDTCHNFLDKHRACRSFCLPVPKCDCLAGFVRGPTGDCIIPQECSKYRVSVTALCSENEEWQFCGTACPKNCDNYDKDVSCIQLCSTGCFCKEPRVRGPDGTCILIEECPHMSSMITVCGENEQFTDCDAHCQKSCSNYDKKISCTRMCSDGCICIPPMVRGPDGNCIEIVDCPERPSVQSANSLVTLVCPGNEYYDACGTPCPKTCLNYDKTITCPSVCVEGCFCKPPLIRDPLGNCVEARDCPNRIEIENADDESHIIECPENEEYLFCGTLSARNCSNYDQYLRSSFVCEPGCYCVAPLVRGPDGTCIDYKECPTRTDGNKDSGPIVTTFPDSVCNENEVFSWCSTVCPDNCNNVNEDRHFCKFVCFPGCKCIPGYVISRNDTCIKKEECVEERPEDCTELEDYNECGSHCELGCFNQTSQSQGCNVQGCKKGCFCKPGYYRSPYMKCITLAECPNKYIRRRLEKLGHSREARYFRTRKY